MVFMISMDFCSTPTLSLVGLWGPVLMSIAVYVTDRLQVGPISRPSCSSPRAWTSNASPAESTLMTRRDTLVSASWVSRSPILVPVRWAPVLPASGESFGAKIMLHIKKRGCQHDLNTIRIEPWYTL